jgi:uncharacterized linocin/CFP29 family protein
MNGTLGRDKIWNDQIWSDIDKAVREEVGRIRVAQKVFPTTVVNNVLPVLINTVSSLPEDEAAVLRTKEDDDFRPFVELSVVFVLTQAQVDGEESMGLAKILARRAASAIAGAEDKILFSADPNDMAKIISDGPPPFVKETGVTITNKERVPAGFITKAKDLVVTVDDSNAKRVGNIIGGVASGIAELSKRAQPGPYALFLPPKRFAQTFSPVASGDLETPGDAIDHVLTGGFHMVNSLSDSVGILASLGGEPVQIILGIDATTAFTQIDPRGNYHFRTFERIQLVVRDADALQTLEFSEEEPPAPDASQRRPPRKGASRKARQTKKAKRRRSKKNP